jgi:hypothetical protein
LRGFHTIKANVSTDLTQISLIVEKQSLEEGQEESVSGCSHMITNFKKSSSQVSFNQTNKLLRNSTINNRVQSTTPEYPFTTIKCGDFSTNTRINAIPGVMFYSYPD